MRDVVALRVNVYAQSSGNFVRKLSPIHRRARQDVRHVAYLLVLLVAGHGKAQTHSVMSHVSTSDTDFLEHFRGS